MQKLYVVYRRTVQDTTLNYPINFYLVKVSEIMSNCPTVERFVDASSEKVVVASFQYLGTYHNSLIENVPINDTILMRYSSLIFVNLDQNDSF